MELNIKGKGRLGYHKSRLIWLSINYSTISLSEFRVSCFKISKNIEMIRNIFFKIINPKCNLTIITSSFWRIILILEIFFLEFSFCLVSSFGNSICSYSSCHLLFFLLENPRPLKHSFPLIVYSWISKKNKFYTRRNLQIGTNKIKWIEFFFLVYLFDYL